jgi:hypothetical protein
MVLAIYDFPDRFDPMMIVHGFISISPDSIGPIFFNPIEKTGECIVDLSVSLVCGGSDEEKV